MCVCVAGVASTSPWAARWTSLVESCLMRTLLPGTSASSSSSNSSDSCSRTRRRRRRMRSSRSSGGSSSSNSKAGGSRGRRSSSRSSGSSGSNSKAPEEEGGGEAGATAAAGAGRWEKERLHPSGAWGLGWEAVPSAARGCCSTTRKEERKKGIKKERKRSALRRGFRGPSQRREAWGGATVKRNGKLAWLSWESPQHFHISLVPDYQHHYPGCRSRCWGGNSGGDTW